MSQYKTGTAAVTNGSAIVTGTGTAWLANVAPGDGFTIAGTGVTYDVGSVDSDTQITLSAPYAGTTGSGLTYTVFRDFEENTGAPEMTQGDIETATVFTRAIRKIGQRLGLATSTVAGIVEKATTAESESAASEKFPDAAGVHAAFNQYGVGSLSSINDLDLNDTRTLNAAFPTTASPNPDGTRSGSIIHLGLNGTVAQQLALGENTDSVYFRRRRLSVWNPWRYLFHNANILGTASQSAGIPTGAIIERGNNADGEYTKFADGFMECWNSAFLVKPSADSTTGAKSASWTYPSAFISEPSVVASIKASDPTAIGGPCVGPTPSTSACDIRYEQKASSAIDVFSCVSARGRWF